MRRDRQLTRCSKRVFILGPSHHVYLSDCALSSQTHYATPLGDLPLDLQGTRPRERATDTYSKGYNPIYSLRAVIHELHQTGHFCRMEKQVDEDEHSIEMQLPYLASIFKGYVRLPTSNHHILTRDLPFASFQAATLVPIMVGSLDSEAEHLYGSLLAPYFDDPHNFFIISSDFCHWGKRCVKSQETFSE